MTSLLNRRCVSSRFHSPSSGGFFFLDIHSRKPIPRYPALSRLRHSLRNIDDDLSMSGAHKLAERRFGIKPQNGATAESDTTTETAAAVLLQCMQKTNHQKINRPLPRKTTVPAVLLHSLRTTTIQSSRPLPRKTTLTAVLLHILKIDTKN